MRRGWRPLAGLRPVLHQQPQDAKARDLAANPTCTISARLADIDLVLEGEATRVTDAPTLEQIAGQFREAGWPAQVEGNAFTAPFSAPSAGPPPWHRVSGGTRRRRGQSCRR